MRIAFIFIVAVLLCYMGFYNRFPLVYSDTDSYMEMGFNNHVLPDRPITYGLFLRHVSLSESLWLVVFAQGFLLAIVDLVVLNGCVCGTLGGVFDRLRSRVVWLLPVFIALTENGVLKKTIPFYKSQHA